MVVGSEKTPVPHDARDASAQDAGPSVRPTERIALAGSVAVLRAGSIAIRPSRARLLGPAVEGALAASAILAIVTLLPVLPLWALLLLLLSAMLLGPIAVLGFVYNIAGSAVLVEREKQSVRYQQGLLGLGLGTAELVPFWRIARYELQCSDDEPLTSGEQQDLVEWEVRLIRVAHGAIVTARRAGTRRSVSGASPMLSMVRRLRRGRSMQEAGGGAVA